MRKMHRVILSADGILFPLIDILRLSFRQEEEKQIRYRLHEILHAIVEACRFRDQAMQKIVIVVKKMHSYYDYPTYPYHAFTVNASGEIDASSKLQDQRNFKKLLKDLAFSLLFQMEELGLYDDKGTLMYSYRPVDDVLFNDVALDLLQQLEWNGVLYEPITPRY